MDNPEKLPTLGTQDTGQRLEKIKGAIKNGQSRETANIGYTRQRMKTNTTNNTTQKTKMMSNTDPIKN
jgi:Sec-independent protein translocase protein TatA